MGFSCILLKSTSPFATFCAASIIYFALNPARNGAKSSTVSFDNFSADGKVFLPVSPSPKVSQSLSIIPLIRGILLFWDMIKEQRASHES